MIDENPKIMVEIEIPRFSGNKLKIELDIVLDLNGDSSHENICEYIFSNIDIKFEE